MRKFKGKKSINNQPERLSVLENNMNSNLEKISLPTSEGYFFMEINDIIRCEANGNYTQFHFKNGNKLLVSKTLKWYESILIEFNFFRINRSDLINLKEIKVVGRQRNPTVLLNDGTSLNLSLFRKSDFLELIKKGI